MAVGRRTGVGSDDLGTPLGASTVPCSLRDASESWRGAAIPAGMGRIERLMTGGVAALNRRLMAEKPSGRPEATSAQREAGSRLPSLASLERVNGVKCHAIARSGDRRGHRDSWPRGTKIRRTGAGLARERTGKFVRLSVRPDPRRRGARRRSPDRVGILVGLDGEKSLPDSARSGDRHEKGQRGTKIRRSGARLVLERTGKVVRSSVRPDLGRRASNRDFAESHHSTLHGCRGEHD